MDLTLNSALNMCNWCIIFDVLMSGYSYKSLSWQLPLGCSTSDCLKQEEIWSLYYNSTRSATGRFDQKVTEQPIIGRKVGIAAKMTKKMVDDVI